MNRSPQRSWSSQGGYAWSVGHHAADDEHSRSPEGGARVDIKDNDIRRGVEAIANLPAATSPESPLLRALGTPAQRDVPPQNGTLAQRAMEEWERTLCEKRQLQS